MASTIAILGMLSSVQTAVATDPRYAYLLDAACISTAVELPRLVAQMQVLQAQEVSREMAANFPADRAWALHDEGATLFVGFRARAVEGSHMRDCVLTFRDGDHQAAVRAIQAAYRVRQILDEVQGTQRMTAFSADLIGLPDSVITIQSSPAIGIHSVTLTQGMHIRR
jgi:hypothetical protein